MSIKTLIKKKLGVEDLNILYQSILESTGVVAFDVGAASGLQPQWNKISKALDFHLFEPNPTSCEGLKKIYSNHKNVFIHNQALFDVDGQAILTITNIPTGSSLLEIDEDSEGQRYSDKNYTYPITLQQIEVKRLDTFIQEKKLPKPDYIKLDTQGTELQILKSLGDDLIFNLTAVEMEISLVKGYKSQESYVDILNYLESFDFYPYDFRVSRNYIKKTGDPSYYSRLFNEKNQEFFVSPRSWEFDVVFFKSTTSVLEKKNRNDVLKLLCAFLSYNFFYDAFDLIDRSKDLGVLSEDESKKIKSIILRIYKTQKVMHLRYMLRMKLKHLFKLFDKNYWARFLWVEYPNT